jgi:PAS domain S-box-containing protein
LSDTFDAGTSPKALRYHDDQRLLEEYRIRNEAMLNSLGEGLIVTDEHGDITTINSYALRKLGFKEDELLGKWMPKTIVAIDQYSQPLDKLNRPIIKALTTGQTVSAYSHYLTKTGNVMPVHITVSPIIIDGLPSGAIETFRDITKEKQLDIAKEEFVSLASHQLRTPATAVKSILSMLANGDFGALTAQQQKYVGKAIYSNDRQLQVIEDLLNVALVDAGKMELDLEYVDLSSLVRDSVADHLHTLKSKDQTIHFKAPSRIRMLADPQKIRMVTDNLVSNASKYSPRGSKIHVSLTESGSYAHLAVQDEGVGIAEDEVGRIFTKFTRLSNEFSSSAGGTGLGLFLAKNIIELHKGTLTVESKEGHGSTFTVRLPTKWSSQL